MQERKIGTCSECHNEEVPLTRFKGTGEKICWTCYRRKARKEQDEADGRAKLRADKKARKTAFSIFNLVKDNLVVFSEAEVAGLYKILHPHLQAITNSAAPAPVDSEQEDDVHTETEPEIDIPDDVDAPVNIEQENGVHETPVNSVNSEPEKPVHSSPKVMLLLPAHVNSEEEKDVHSSQKPYLELRHENHVISRQKVAGCPSCFPEPAPAAGPGTADKQEPAQNATEAQGRILAVLQPSAPYCGYIHYPEFSKYDLLKAAKFHPGEEKDRAALVLDQLVSGGVITRTLDDTDDSISYVLTHTPPPDEDDEDEGEPEAPEEPEPPAENVAEEPAPVDPAPKPPADTRNSTDNKRYWITPPALLEQIKAEFCPNGEELFDPCPHPLPAGFDGLTCEWGLINYVNCPWKAGDTISSDGKKKGLTHWARKAIEEHAKGKTVIMIGPLGWGWTEIMTAAKAESRVLGQEIKFLAIEDNTPSTRSRQPCVMYILRGNRVLQPSGAEAAPPVISSENRKPDGKWTAHYLIYYKRTTEAGFVMHDIAEYVGKLPFTSEIGIPAQLKADVLKFLEAKGFNKVEITNIKLVNPKVDKQPTHPPCPKCGSEYDEELECYPCDGHKPPKPKPEPETVIDVDYSRISYLDSIRALGRGVKVERAYQIITELKKGRALSNHELEGALGIGYQQVTEITRLLHKHKVIEHDKRYKPGYWILTKRYLAAEAEELAEAKANAETA